MLISQFFSWLAAILLMASLLSVYAKTALIGSGMRFEQLYSSIWATAWWNNACTKIFVAT